MGELEKVAGYRGPAIHKPHAGVVEAKFDVQVDSLNLLEGSPERHPKMIHSRVLVPELLPERNPRNKAGFFGINSVERWASHV